VPPHIALLRGVNVGGHKKIAMADLRACVESLGFGNVRTVLQSGNVVFEAGRRSPASLETLLEHEVARRLALTTDFFVRTAAQWRQIIEHNPFTMEAARDPGHLLVLCLKDAPSEARVAALDAAIEGRERVRVYERAMYAVYPDGVGRSKLTVTLIDKVLGTSATGRNWNTVRKLAILTGGGA